MGLNFFLRSLLSNEKTSNISQPNPESFTVIWEKQNGEYLLAMVKYSNTTNFEGNKILLIKGLKTLANTKFLDPHFLKYSDIQLVARFRPDIEGETMANLLFNRL